MSRACGQRSRRQACAFGPCAASATCGKPRMASRVTRRSSIRRRLLLFLIPSLLLPVGGAAALTYYVALHVATFAYDRSLLDPALDMAANPYASRRSDPTRAYMCRLQKRCISAIA